MLHDLNQAARYADRLVAMKEGRIVAEGRPGDIVTAGLVREVFGLDAVIVPDPVTGSPLVVPGAPWSPAPSASSPTSVSTSASASGSDSASAPTPGKVL